jgi:hypothetical protein
MWNTVCQQPLQLLLLPQLLLQLAWLAGHQQAGEAAAEAGGVAGAQQQEQQQQAQGGAGQKAGTQQGSCPRLLL